MHSEQRTLQKKTFSKKGKKMEETKYKINFPPRLMKEPTACAYTAMGRTQFREWAASIGAVRRFGRAVSYDRKVIDEALDKLKQEDSAS